MTVRVETQADDGAATARSKVRVPDRPGNPEAHVRLLKMFDGPQVGVGLFDDRARRKHSVLWLSLEQAYHAADVLDLLAVWPADAIAALAAAVRRSAEAAAPAGAEPGALL